MDLEKLSKMSSLQLMPGSDVGPLSDKHYSSFSGRQFAQRRQWVSEWRTKKQEIVASPRLDPNSKRLRPCKEYRAARKSKPGLQDIDENTELQFADSKIRTENWHKCHHRQQEAYSEWLWNMSNQYPVWDGRTIAGLDDTVRQELFDAEYVRQPPAQLVTKRKTKVWRAYTRLNNYMFRQVNKPTKSKIARQNLLLAEAQRMNDVAGRQNRLLRERIRDYEEDSRIFTKSGRIRQELDNTFVKRMLKAKKPKPLLRRMRHSKPVFASS